MILKQIQFVIVNYKNNDETQTFLNHLKRLPGLDAVTVHLVNNTDGRVAFEERKAWDLSGWTSEVVIHEPQKNLGYMGAGQYVFEQLKVQNYEWFILANSDLELEEQFFIKLQHLKTESGLIGPSLHSPLSGGETNPYMVSRPSARKMKQIAVIFDSLLISRLYQYMGLAKKIVCRVISPRLPGAESYVYAVHGAILIFSRRYFERGGNLALPFFLFNEEIFAAETCRQIGLKVQYVPSIRVTHREHGSMGWNFSNQILRYKREAARIVYEKYFSSASPSSR